MGSSTILDIIGSTIVAGLLLLMALRLDSSALETSAVYNQNLILQQNMTTLVTILETDFRRIGYCKNWQKVANPTDAIRIAEANRFRFWTSVNADSTLDSITYSIGDTTELLNTPNPRDRYLYRQINTKTPQKLNLGVTMFQFRFRDVDDTVLAFPIADPHEIAAMELAVELESSSPITQEYGPDSSRYQMFWRQIRVTARNLKNR